MCSHVEDMTSFLHAAVLVLLPLFWSLNAATINTLESCAAEKPCGCYEKTESFKDHPEVNKVRIVDCSDKRFSAVPFFRRLKNITFDRILLQNNRIAVVPSDAFYGLDVTLVNLSGNKIDTIEDDAFRGLESRLITLDLSSNRLQSWPVPALSRLRRLETLNLSTNPGISEFPVDSFKGLASLKKLHVGNCPEGFSIHHDAFRSVKTTLNELMIHHCFLKEVPRAFQGLQNLTVLQLPSNAFSKLRKSDFKGLAKLKTLDLSSNKNLTWPESFTADTLNEIGTNLETLDLSSIKFTSVPQIFKPLKNLKFLYLSYNNVSRITRGTFSSLGTLEGLYLDGNPMGYPPGTFDGLTSSLRYVGISNQDLNRLPNAELTSLRSLKTVSADGNNFRVLEGDFTVGIAATTYHLNNCSITEISPFAFSRKLTQVRLSLRNNNLKNLEFVQDPCYFWRIDVADNPIVCDCFIYKLSKYPHLLLKGVCAGSDDVTGMTIGSSEFDDVMYWKCVDHFFEDTKLCSKWWLNDGQSYRQSLPLFTFSILIALSCL